MKRRVLLAATGAGAVLGTSGCLGSSQNSTPPENDTENNTEDCSELYSADVTRDPLSPSNDRFELSLSEATVATGDELRIELTNITDSEESTGNDAKYAIQLKSDEEWIPKMKYSSPDWSSEAISHEPGEGFSWSFDVTSEGFSKLHQFCRELTPGAYRFVFWGTAPNVGVQFEVIE